MPIECLSELEERPCFWYGCDRRGGCILDEKSQESYQNNPIKEKEKPIGQLLQEKKENDRKFWLKLHPKRVVSLIVERNHDAACRCCYAISDLTFDHKIPLSKGGKNSLKNGQILCNECNAMKGDRIIGIKELRKLFKEGVSKKL